MCPHVEPADLERIPLEAHLEELGRRSEAVGGVQGGSTYFEEDLQIFLRYAGECGLLLKAAPPELNRPPSDEGNEHQVWFLENRGSFLKATWPGFLGLKVVYRSDADSRASPIDYHPHGRRPSGPIDLRVQRLTDTLLDAVKLLAK
jgi:hypothetical protein